MTSGGTTDSFNGFDTIEGQRQARFKPAAGREIALDKARFGRGNWQLVFAIRGITGAQGAGHSFVFPPRNGEQDRYIELDVY